VFGAFRRPQFDTTVRQEFAHGRAGGVAEDPQRLRLRGEQRDGRVEGAQLRGGHDRELVRRQRPRRARRHDDGELAAMAALELGKDAVDLRDVDRAAEGE
jgi:hypothetical protein